MPPDIDQPSNIVQFQKKEEAKYICSACGADRICNCSAPAVEKLAQKQAQDRQRSKAYRERKAEENQQQRHVTESDEANPTLLPTATVAAIEAAFDAAAPPKAKAPSSLDQLATDIRRRLAANDAIASKLERLQAEDPEAFAEALKEIAESEAVAGAETEDLTFDPDDSVEEPTIVLTNVLDSIKDSKAVAEAYRKILKRSPFDREAKKLISDEIALLIRKWRSVQSVLAAKPDDPPPSGPSGESEPKATGIADAVPEHTGNSGAAAVVPDTPVPLTPPTPAPATPTPPSPKPRVRRRTAKALQGEADQHRDTAYQKIGRERRPGVSSNPEEARP